MSQEETDALKVVLSGNGVKPGEVSLEVNQSTLKTVHQLLVKKGYWDLATNLRTKLEEGTYVSSNSDSLYLRSSDSSVHAA